MTVPLIKDTSGSGNYESCWPAIKKDAHGIVFVFNPENSAHVKQLDSLYQVIVYLSTYAHPPYSTSDLRQIRYTTHPT